MTKDEKEYVAQMELYIQSLQAKTAVSETIVLHCKEDILQFKRVLRVENKYVKIGQKRINSAKSELKKFILSHK